VTPDAVYRERCTTWSDIYEHLPFMHDHVVGLGAEVVVELGVRSGNSTAAFLAAVEYTDGHVWSVDIAEPPSFASERWTFVKGDDLAVADQLPDEIDVLFIDTTHFYEHTLAELRLYGPRALSILLHDTELERPYKAPRRPLFPVRVAVDEYVAETGRQVEYRAGCYGLAVIGA
jgi:cephalosporin hydroxylase